jgi:hypothetical protein
MTRTLFQRIYSAICALLALASLWSAYAEWRTWHGIAASAIYAEIALFVFFGVTSLSLAGTWGVGRWLSATSGALLILYAIAVVLIGWEDVGGARGAIPLSTGTGLAGLLGIGIAIFWRGFDEMAV